MNSVLGSKFRSEPVFDRSGVLASCLRQFLLLDFIYFASVLGHFLTAIDRIQIDTGFGSPLGDHLGGVLEDASQLVPELLVCDVANFRVVKVWVGLLSCV